MREHPVPQNVTSYEFHLIGNMTLKQFLEIAAGIVLGVIVYTTNLPTVIKWPLIIFFAGLGAMIAFVPFEGRPLDQWFFAFIKAIYRPTQFYWKKDAKIPDYFTYTKTTDKTFAPEFDYRPIKQQRIQEFIKTLPGDSLIATDIEEEQKARDLVSLFEQVEVQEVVIEKQQQKPSMTVAPRNLQPKAQVVQYIASSETPTANPMVMTANQNLFQETGVILSQEIVGKKSEQAPTMQTEQPQPVVIPEQQTPEIEQTIQTSVSHPSQQTPLDTVNVFSNVHQDVVTPQIAQQVTTSQNLPFPQKPNFPNTVVGMVFDQSGNILNQAIVEIIDQQGMPVRAVRTNAVGQFSISTPLPDGNYFIQVEKAPHQFSPLQLALQQTYLDPLDIHAVS